MAKVYQAGSNAANEGFYASANAAAKSSPKSIKAPDASQVAYSAAKRKYGSSSAWYDAAYNNQQEKQGFVDELKQQIKNANKLNNQTNFGGRHGMRELGLASANFALDTGGKSVEDLQKELAAAERQLANANVDLEYATEWRHYAQKSP